MTLTEGIEDKLGVANGFPIVDLTAGRGGVTADLNADAEREYAEGLVLATAAGVASAYMTLYGSFVLSGSHPRTAVKTALDSLGIDASPDTFLVVNHSGVTTEI